MTSPDELRRRREAAMKAARSWAADAQGESRAVQRSAVRFWVELARADNRQLVAVKRKARGGA